MRNTCLIIHCYEACPPEEALLGAINLRGRRKLSSSSTFYHSTRIAPCRFTFARAPTYELSCTEKTFRETLAQSEQHAYLRSGADKVVGESATSHA